MYEYNQTTPYNHYEIDNRQTEQLLKDMTKAINDEFAAIQYYTQLAKLAPNEQFRQAVLGVRQDEIRHFSSFARSYTELTGDYPKISLDVDLPKSFKKGVRESIKDEAETVPFYQSIASRVPNPMIQNRFLRAANDEQRHAQIFQSINSYL
ncbi:ferritin-like domain-containing protein [Bacillus sp. CGMCC 1.16541]|uniref:ferritin-like domain-containing protein n=1 Tax=Bacillus sp. CGMCC 1.16541 TaxID=2185143 RepID=UPI000D72A22C|nr:ferritin-like domain-containing protein [Bacillus sp. CGMCC 1.16541]